MLALYEKRPRERTTDLRRHCELRMQALDTAAQPWLNFCRNVAEHLMPSRLPYLNTPGGIQQLAGEQNSHIVDSVGHQSLQTAGAGLGHGTMPPTSPFFELVVRNEFGEDDELRGFLQQQALEMRATLNQSNANQALASYREELLAFGTAAALLVEDDEDVIRIDLFSVGEYRIAEDYRGRVDTLYRRLTRTVGQLADEFGVDALCPSSKLAHERKEYDTVISCVHAIEPDLDHDNPEMPWRSVYYELSAGATEVLAVRYFKRFPCLVTRWTKLPGTAYGHGRGMDALPHLVRLRKMVYRYGQAMAQKADPALQIPQGMAQHEVRSLPGGRSTVLGQQPITNLMKVDLELRELDEAIEKTRQDIRDSLGSSLVASLRQITHQMTAREVDTRTAQDLMEFLPAIYRQHEELLNPLIEMLWEAREAAGLIGDMPAALRDEDPIDIEFTSPLARKQRQGEVDAIVRTYAIAGEIAKVREDILDNLDPDTAIRKIAEIEGAPVGVLLPIEQVKRMRAARERTQQAEAVVDSAQKSADVAATVAEVTTAAA